MEDKLSDAMPKIIFIMYIMDKSSAPAEWLDTIDVLTIFR
jgi:hypothetical protein